MHLTNWKTIMSVCFEANNISFENKFSNFKRKLCISSRLKFSRYGGWFAFFIFHLRLYSFLSFHNRNLSQLPLNQNKVLWIPSIWEKKSDVSFKPCARKSDCREILILRYNSKSLRCFTYWNSHFKSHRCLNYWESIIFL